MALGIIKKTMDESKLLITGGSGYLGSQCKIIMPRAQFPTRQFLDVSNEESIKTFFEKNDVESIIHLAAVAKVVYSDNNKELVYNTNIKGTRLLLKYAKESGVKFFIYLSTACVYSGENQGMYSEDDIPYPKHYYGWSKLVAEEISKSFDSNEFQVIIVRTNFTKMPWEYPRAFTDRFGTYLFGKGVAKGLKEIWSKKPNLPIIHLCGEKKLSMYEYAKLGNSDVGEMTFEDYKENTPLTKNMCLKTNYWKTYKIEDYL